MLKEFCAAPTADSLTAKLERAAGTTLNAAGEPVAVAGRLTLAGGIPSPNSRDLFELSEFHVTARAIVGFPASGKRGKNRVTSLPRKSKLFLAIAISRMFLDSCNAMRHTL